MIRAAIFAWPIDNTGIDRASQQRQMRFWQNIPDEADAHCLKFLDRVTHAEIDGF